MNYRLCVPKRLVEERGKSHFSEVEKTRFKGIKSSTLWLVGFLVIRYVLPVSYTHLTLPTKRIV